jgi:hypothetical protein
MGFLNIRMSLLNVSDLVGAGQYRKATFIADATESGRPALSREARAAAAAALPAMRETAGSWRLVDKEARGHPSRAWPGSEFPDEVHAFRQPHHDRSAIAAFLKKIIGKISSGS